VSDRSLYTLELQPVSESAIYEERTVTRQRLLAAVSVMALTAVLAVRADDKASGFTPLFNGKDLTGWKTYLQGDADPKKTWSIENGEIHCTGKPAGYLLTEKEYGDYVLRVQWKFSGTPGNSGVFVHVSGPDKIWPKGVECQLMSGRAGDFWLVDGFKMTVPHAEGRQDPNQARHYVRIGESYKKLDGKDNRGRDKYEIVGKPVEKPLGEWNQYEITCQGDTVKSVVNGHHVNTGTHCESSKGHILLQSEGAPIVFRNIEIKSLK
jgi:3-keto-disaccharide hydrolase